MLPKRCVESSALDEQMVVDRLLERSFRPRKVQFHRVVVQDEGNLVDITVQPRAQHQRLVNVGLEAFIRVGDAGHLRGRQADGDVA